MLELSSQTWINNEKCRAVLLLIARFEWLKFEKHINDAREVEFLRSSISVVENISKIFNN